MTELSDGEALLMEAGEAVGKDCVDRHTFFITPVSSCRDADLPSPPTIKPSPFHSHGQPGQLRRRGWAENHPPQAPATAPCACRRPAQHRKAVAVVRRDTGSAGEIGKNA